MGYFHIGVFLFQFGRSESSGIRFKRAFSGS